MTTSSSQELKGVLVGGVLVGEEESAMASLRLVVPIFGIPPQGTVFVFPGKGHRFVVDFVEVFPDLPGPNRYLLHGMWYPLRRP